MLVPNRHGSNSVYRYGFQGQEKDNEIKGGEGNSLNYTFRMHDPRVGRFFAIDPLTHKYPYYTPYSFSGNKVIEAIELEGAEEKIVWYANNANKPTILLKLSDKNSNWPSHQIANYNIVKSLDEAGLVTWSYGKGQYYQSNRTDGSMYKNGVWNGSARGTLIIREINGKYVVAFNSKSLDLKYDKDYDWKPVIKGIKTFNPIYPVPDKSIEGSEKYSNTVSNYKAGVLAPLTIEATAIGGLSNAGKVKNVFSLMLDADEVLGGENGSIIENNISDKYKSTFNASKAIFNFIGKTNSLIELSNSKGGTEIIKNAADAVNGTTNTLNSAQKIKENE